MTASRPSICYIVGQSEIRATPAPSMFGHPPCLSNTSVFYKESRQLWRSRSIGHYRVMPKHQSDSKSAFETALTPQVMLYEPGLLDKTRPLSIGQQNRSSQTPGIPRSPFFSCTAMDWNVVHHCHTASAVAWQAMFDDLSSPIRSSSSTH